MNTAKLRSIPVEDVKGNNTSIYSHGTEVYVDEDSDDGFEYAEVELGMCDVMMIMMHRRCRRRSGRG